MHEKGLPVMESYLRLFASQCSKVGHYWVRPAPASKESVRSVCTESGLELHPLLPLQA